jgi:hypothetical protein
MNRMKNITSTPSIQSFPRCVLKMFDYRQPSQQSTSVIGSKLLRRFVSLKFQNNYHEPYVLSEIQMILCARPAHSSD